MLLDLLGELVLGLPVMCHLADASALPSGNVRASSISSNT
jgi:hypothetical protein